MTFDVVLIGAGMNKVALMGALREATGCDLVTARNLTENLGPIVTGVDRNEMERVKMIITAAGGLVDVRQHADDAPTDDDRHDLWLSDPGPEPKVVVDVLVRIAGLARDDAEALASRGGRVLAGVALDDAKVAHQQLEAAGATVEVTPAR